MHCVFAAAKAIICFACWIFFCCSQRLTSQPNSTRRLQPNDLPIRCPPVGFEASTMTSTDQLIAAAPYSCTDNVEHLIMGPLNSWVHHIYLTSSSGTWSNSSWSNDLFSAQLLSFTQVSKMYGHNPDDINALTSTLRYALTSTLQLDIQDQPHTPTKKKKMMVWQNWILVSFHQILNKW